LNTTEADEIKKVLNRIRKEVDDLKTSFDELTALKKTDPLYSTTLRGILTAPGAKAEIILSFILKVEKLKQPRTIGNENHISLQELISSLRELLPQEVFTHLRTIQNWRNHSSHGNYLDRIDSDTLTSVKTAFSYFTKWFFEEYVKQKFPGYQPVEEQKTIPEEFVPPKSSTIESEVKTRKPSKSKAFIIAGVFTILGLIAIYTNYKIHKESEVPSPKIKVEKTKEWLNKQETCRLITNYYNSINADTSDAYNFFAPQVYSYYQYRNINRTKVDLFRKMEVVFLNKKNDFNVDSIRLYLTTDTLMYWRFWNTLQCNKKTNDKLRPQKFKILTEFGINKEGRIASILELDTIKPKKIKKKRRRK